MLEILDKTVIKLDELILTIGFARKFKKYWGTTVVNGIPVFNKRVYIYPKQHVLNSPNTVKLIKLIGAYQDIMRMDPQGIDSMWLYLNPEKLSSYAQTEFNAMFISNLIEDNMEQDVWYNFTLNYTLEDPVLQTMNGVDLYNYTKTNWSTIHSTLYSTSNTREMVRLSELSKFFFYEQDQQDFVMEYVNAKKTVSTVFKSDPYNQDNIMAYDRKVLQATVAIDFRVKRVSEIATDSRIVTKVVEVANQTEQLMIIQNSQMNYNSEDMSWSWFEPLISDEMWEESHLRVDYWDNLPYKKRADLISFILDQDYQEEDTNFWEDLLVVVIQIAAIVGAAFTGGWSLLIGAMLLQLIAYVAAKNGQYALARKAMQGAEFLGYVSLVYGIGQAIKGYQVAAQKALEKANEEAIKEAATEAVKEGIKAAGTELAESEVAALIEAEIVKMTADVVTKQLTTEYIVKFAINSVTDSVWGMVNNALKIFAKIYELKAKNEIKDINANNKELDTKLDELNQKQQLDNDTDWEMSTRPLEAIVYSLDPIAVLRQRYDFMSMYLPTKTNICSSGPFKPVGCFNFPNYHRSS